MFKLEQANDKNIIKKEEEVAVSSLEEDKGVPDILDTDLKVLFVGINPGLTSTARGHHYAGPTNHFWPCLSESGLVDRKVTFEDDVDMPNLYRLGFTNLTARTTRKASDLSLNEQRLGIPVLNSKFEMLRPRIACFVGKGIYEIYSKQKCKEMGVQNENHAIPWLSGEGKTIMFVMPSTSGIVSAYQKPDKIK
jgi:mismatch-specific thymine-DNA glycosylase